MGVTEIFFILKCEDEELKAHHQNQYKKRYKANIHIVNCYLARQEENKETWRRMRVTKEQRKSSFAREKVTTLNSVAIEIICRT